MFVDAPRLVELVRVPSWLVGQVGGVPLGVGVSPPFTAAHPPPAPRSTLRVQGWTALYRACWYADGSRTEIVKVLVEANADVNIPDIVSLAVQLGGKGVVMGRGLQRPTDRTPSPSRMGSPPCTLQH